MTVNVTINPDEQELGKPEEPTRTKMNLQARKALDGSIIVTDHPDIDIVIHPEKMKIVAFAKKSMDDSIYATQSRLFEYLFKKGVISYESIKGGSVYSSLEGTILAPNTKMPIDEVALFTVGKFLEEERPVFMYEKAVEDQEEDRLLDPETADSTELGEIPHSTEKGSIIPHQVRRYVQGF
jgi:hypothetical protein